MVLQDKVTKKVVTLVLAFLFSIPVFTISNWTTPPDSFTYGLILIQQFGARSDIGLKVFDDVVRT